MKPILFKKKLFCCCAAKDDLIQTLDSMLEKNERAGRQNLDYIIVETNGLADPC